MNGFRLDQKEAALKGGYSGTAIQVGKSAESLLIKKVASSKDGFKMPPMGSALTAVEIGVLRAWIDQGADWPAQTVVASAARCPRLKSHIGHSSGQATERLWSGAPGRHPIDAFILAKWRR
jgi:hypothetical protein